MTPNLPGLRDEGDRECKTSVTKPQRSRAEIPSLRKLASKDITSDSVRLQFASRKSN